MNILYVASEVARYAKMGGLADVSAALATYRDPAAWRARMANGMAVKFSWDMQGKPYEELYRRLAVMR